MPPHVDEVKAQALPSDMDPRTPPSPPAERRTHQRTGRDNQTTSLVQMILRDPGAAGDTLERDLTSGGDPNVVFGLLDAAEAILQLRGVDAGAQLAALRQRLKRHIG